MSTLNTENFEIFYQKTYNTVLNYIICKCQNLDDVNEILQDSYVELYKSLQKKKTIKFDNDTAYIIGISKNIIKKYYKNKYKTPKNILSISETFNENEIQLISDEDLEANFITKNNIEDIWNYLNKKNILIAKIFYLYYALDYKISEISKELNINESTTKNYIYRTLKDLQKNFGKEIKHDK